MYNLNQEYYACALNFAPHNKLAIMPKRHPAKGEDQPERPNLGNIFAGMGPAFGAEPLGKGSVRFNMYAPEGCKVEVAGMPGTAVAQPDGGKTLLEEVEPGFYSGVVEGWAVGFQYIQFYVNDIPSINGKCPIGVGYGKSINFCEVPGDPEETDVYALKDVPHGSVTMEIYYSTVTEMYRNCYVYTPPAYDPANKKYPVLFIQHGGGENETGWLWQGRINYIMDNLLAAGEAEEMIIVMNAGYAFKAEDEYRFMPGDLGAVLEKDCLPMLARKYAVYTDRDHIAMAGLSMGSYQTQYAAAAHPDLFAWEGIFSGNPTKHMDEIGLDTNFADLEQAKKMKLIFVSVGEQEGRCIYQKEFVEQMKAEGLDNIVYDSWPGVHEWRVWRHAAYAFLKLLFK